MPLLGRNTARADALLRRPAGISEMDALIAYLQMLGTRVAFSTFELARKR